ncbi:MAG: hypothetical protein ACM37W_06460 [Actinomycetota bacterium]
MNTQGCDYGRKLLPLMLMVGVLGVSAVGCNETSPTPSPTSATSTSSGTPNSPSPTPAATLAAPTPTPSAKTPTSTATLAAPTPTPSAKTPTPAASLTPSGSQAELPKPNEKGDYSRTSHKSWQVVDPNPAGVSCRMGKYSIEQIQDPGSNITLDIANWPVIGTLKQGQTFEIDPGPAGFGTLTDTQRQPWFLVNKNSTPGAPMNCFVRANSQFVKPVASK